MYRLSFLIGKFSEIGYNLTFAMIKHTYRRLKRGVYLPQGTEGIIFYVDFIRRSRRRKENFNLKILPTVRVMEINLSHSRAHRSKTGSPCRMFSFSCDHVQNVGYQ